MLAFKMPSMPSAPDSGDMRPTPDSGDMRGDVNIGGLSGFLTVCPDIGDPI